MKNVIRILLYALLVLLVGAIAYMIYKRSKTPVDDAPPAAEMADSLFMDQEQAGAPLTSEDSMILDLTGQLPHQVGAPNEAAAAPSEGTTTSGTPDYSAPTTTKENTAAVNTNPKAQKVAEKVTTASTPAKPASKPAPEHKATTEKKEDHKAKTPAPVKKPSSSSASYYVVCGSFIKADNADDQVKKLKKMGYNGAMRKVFGSSEYYSAVVGMYNSREQAEQIVKKLEGKGEKAFLKAK